MVKRRLEHLKEYEGSTGVALAYWKKKRVDRMLVEYFLRAGYYETAVKCARHSNIEASRLSLSGCDLVK